MRIQSFTVFFFLGSWLFSLYSQEAVIIDSTSYENYREDQFYLSLTFNLLVNKPEELRQSGFSGGLALGYIRDMPINTSRNTAIGLGAGFSMNNYNQNLVITRDAADNTNFEILDQNDYDKNWFTTYLAEVPIQFRWRTSTSKDYSFWRIYTGVKVGYVFSHKFNFEQEVSQVIIQDLPQFDPWRIAATFSFGYASFNMYFYYSLNPFFTDSVLQNGQKINVNPLKLGVIFYLL
ncbi:MAG: porin family protein [Leeuwenhoekiella sp.]